MTDMNHIEIIDQHIAKKGALSAEALLIGKVLAQTEDEAKGRLEKKFHAWEIYDKVTKDLSLDKLNEGVLELEAKGLVRLERLPGTEPYQFAYALSTFSIFFSFKDELSFDPLHDVVEVRKIIEEVNFIDGLKLEKLSGLSVARINRAVEALEHYNYVKTYRCKGTEPFIFAYAKFLAPSDDNSLDNQN